MVTMDLAKKALFGLGGLLLLTFAIGVFLPSTARVERRVTIDAPPATVYALVNDFHQINKWSPWLAVDPNARFEIEGPRRGVGASLSWSGRIVGEGSQTIVVSVPFERVVSRVLLDGNREARASFKLEATEFGTSVSWVFERDFGRNVFGRYFGLLLDGIVGKDYEEGLAGLRTLAESLPASDFSDLEIEHMTVESADIAYIPSSSEPLAQAISEALGDAYFRILSFIDEHDLTEAGAPISISRAFSGAELRFDAAVPVRGIAADTPAQWESVRLGKSYGGPVIRITHRGSYLTLGRTHDKIAAYLAALGLARNGDAWESYVSDPTRTSTDELLTYVYYPIQPEG